MISTVTNTNTTKTWVEAKTNFSILFNIYNFHLWFIYCKILVTILNVQVHSCKVHFTANKTNLISIFYFHCNCLLAVLRPFRHVCHVAAIKADKVTKSGLFFLFAHDLQRLLESTTLKHTRSLLWGDSNQEQWNEQDELSAWSVDFRFKTTVSVTDFYFPRF